MIVEPITVAAADGTVLAGTLFRPQTLTRHVVLVAGGLGIHQRFYAPFGHWLAERGHLVMTFDLRGMGASRSLAHARSLRGLNADMLTWARLDFSAAVGHLCNVAHRKQITLIGHSLGAHHAGMTDAGTQARLRKLVSVAAGSGYWRDWALPSRRLAPLMLHVAAPLLTPLFGYFPGRRLKMVGDLPGAAMQQWSRWCRHPEFAWGADPELVKPSMQSARFPIHALSFSDDEAMTEVCTRKLLKAFVNSPSEVEIIEPVSLGVQSIGHVGAFRREAGAALWPLIESRLD